MNEVRDVPERHRYEILVDGELIGLADYRLSPGHITVFHTEIHDARQHRGLGGELVAAVLDDIRVRGLLVVPECPFVRHFIREHPEYDDLVDHAALDALHLPD